MRVSGTMTRETAKESFLLETEAHLLEHLRMMKHMMGNLSIGMKILSKTIQTKEAISYMENSPGMEKLSSPTRMITLVNLEME